MASKRSGDRAKPGIGVKAGKSGGKKRGSKLKDLDAKGGRRVRGGDGPSESVTLNFGKIKYEY